MKRNRNWPLIIDIAFGIIMAMLILVLAAFAISVVVTGNHA